MPIEQVITIVKSIDDVPDSKIENAYIYAQRKLDRIISREGTLQGQRLKPEYLLQLVYEALAEITAMEVFGIEKEQAA